MRGGLRFLSRLGPAARLRVVALGTGVLVVLATFAACGACGKRIPAGDDPTSARDSDGGAPSSLAAQTADAAALRDPLLWEHAREGDAEDLAALAASEGAVGLVEAASDPTLRQTAVRAMAYARGWAQLPLLAKLANGKDDEEAKLALDAAVELATRPRRAEDPEDADELREGCEGLFALSHSDKPARSRRVLAIRALRMMPCPPTDGGASLDGALPKDVDAK